MKQLLIISLLLVCASVKAELYIDVGLAMANNNYRIASSSTKQCTFDNDTLIYSCVVRDQYKEPNNPYGLVEIGYSFDNTPVSLFFLHISSLPETDGGIDLLGVKYRFNL